MNSIDKLNEKILTYLNRKLILQGMSGIVNSIISLLIVWISTFAADSILHFSVPVRWFVLTVNLAISFFLIYQFLLKDLISGIRLRRSENLTPVTREIGRQFPDINDTLTNIYQLAGTQNGHDSAALRQMAVENFLNKIKDLNFILVLKIKEYLFAPVVIVLILAGSLMLVGLIPRAMGISAQRILNPAGTYELLPGFSFAVNPGDTTLLSGAKFVVSAEYSGPVAENLVIKYRTYDDDYYNSVVMKQEDDRYLAEISNVRSDVVYQLQAVPVSNAAWREKLLSDQYRVTVKEPPVITELQVRIKPPAYTGLPEQVADQNQGNIIAYQGSEVRVTAISSKKLESGKIKFPGQADVGMTVRENRVTGAFTVRESGSYHISLTDPENIANQDPIVYQISAIKDRYPTIELIEPGADLEIPPDAAINLVSEANDDFGFTQLKLNYQIAGDMASLGDTTWKQLDIPVDDLRVKYFQRTWLWNFQLFNIGFGDALNYYVSVADNDGYNGPKWARSKNYQIRFPTLDQIFSEFDKTQDENVDKTKEIAEDSQELKKKLEEISREMKRETEVDWERKKQIEAAIDKQEKIQKKLNEIEKELEEALQKMEQSQLLSPEILAKYQQLQQLFQELMTPELAKSLEELRKSLEELNKQNVEKSLNQFKFNQEQFVQNVERTLELFKKIRMEQELDRMVQISKAMMEKQQEISRDLTREEKNRTEIEHDAGSQQDLLDQINNSLDDLKSEPELKKYPDTEQMLNQSRDQIDRRNMAGQIKDLQSKINQGEKNQAGEMSQELAAEMTQLHHSLTQAQQNMKQLARSNIMQKMERTTNNLLKLSQNEEQLWRDTQSASGVSDRMREIAAEQQNVAENASRVFQDIVELSHETFALPQELNQALGKANYNMRKSISDLEQRNQASAGKAQIEAMSGLNEAITAMQAAGEQMKSSDSPFGLESFLQQMQKLAQGQGQINQESLNFMQGEQGQPGGSGNSGRLKQMASEQRAIQEAFDQLREEHGNSKALGRMDQISQDMQEVVKEMEALKIDRKTIERQQRILTRMLDAQRSVREREYSRERKAETGKNYAVRSPGDDQQTEDQRAKKLQVDLMHALQEGYLPDYEKLIEAYFKLLNQQNMQESAPENNQNQ